MDCLKNCLKYYIIGIITLSILGIIVYFLTLISHDILYYFSILILTSPFVIIIGIFAAYIFQKLFKNNENTEDDDFGEFYNDFYF